MTGSEESRLDSALRRGLKGIEGLPESARFADESITKYLKQKFNEVLLSEYRRRSYRNEDEAALVERTNRIMDDVVLDAQRMYRLFELRMNDKLDEFWEGLGLGAKGEGASEPSVGPGRVPFADSYSIGASATPAWRRRYYCIEGCLFEGEQAYLEHRDRGHHPVPV
jgi:hypothetical protein